MSEQERAQAQMEHYRVMAGELRLAVKDFERRVYRNGLGKLIADLPSRGGRGQLGDIQVLTYVIAGRVVITLARHDGEVTVIAADGEEDPRMGLQSADVRMGTLQGARDVLYDAIAAWRHHGIRLVEDEHLRII